MTKKKIVTLCLSESLVKKIDSERGMVPRSPYVEGLLQKLFKKVEK